MRKTEWFMVNAIMVVGVLTIVASVYLVYKYMTATMAAAVPPSRQPKTAPAIPIDINVRVRSEQDATASSTQPPVQRYPPRRPSLNVPTRGEHAFQQIGILHDKQSDRIIPIYGRPTYVGSSRWHYYTSTDGFREIKLPLTYQNRDCLDTTGCHELYDKEELEIPEYKSTFVFKKYAYDAPRYNSDVV